MKKIKYLFLSLLLSLSPVIFAETKVQPFIDCRIADSSGGWKFNLSCSAGFPVHESKLFLILHYNNIVKKIELPMQETIVFDWKFSSETISFCAPPIKYDFPRVSGCSLKFTPVSSQILLPGKKVCLQAWEWASSDNKQNQPPAGGKLELELSIPENILQQYAKAVSYEDFVIQKYLNKIHVPDYWLYAKEFPEVPKNSKSRYRAYPPMIRANIVLLNRNQRAYEDGELDLLPILNHEISIIEKMLYAKNLPETMRKQLLMEIYRCRKQILSLTEAAYAAGTETQFAVDTARAKLNIFMHRHDIKE